MKDKRLSQNVHIKPRGRTSWFLKMRKVDGYYAKKEKIIYRTGFAVLLSACGKEDSTGRGRLKDAPAARETASEPVEEREKLS